MKAVAFATLALLAAGTTTAYAQKSVDDLKKQELKKIAALEAKTKAARQAYFKKPKDPQAKAAFTKAAMTEAEEVLVAQSLDSKVRYPRSLRLYREIVRVEPKNKKALERISLIEGIYKSLKKPIPM